MGFIRGAVIICIWMGAMGMEYIAYSMEKCNAPMSGIPQIIIPLAAAAATAVLSIGKSDD